MNEGAKKGEREIVVSEESNTEKGVSVGEMGDRESEAE